MYKLDVEVASLSSSSHVSLLGTAADAVSRVVELPDGRLEAMMASP